MNRVLATIGQGEFVETTYTVPPLTDTEIQVRAVMTGVCRSDIDMMQGNFGPLPLHMQGHEGIGEVIAIGDAIYDVDVGDYVATRGEPAYADVYNVRDREYVKIPSAEPKYIIEPVACGVNLINHSFKDIASRSGPNSRLLILGSGFLAWVAYNAILINELEFKIDVVGGSNRDLWANTLKSAPQGQYDVIIDLSDRTDTLDGKLANIQALIIFGVQKTVTTDFGDLLWKACTVTFPSPRTEDFYHSMREAAAWIQQGKLVVDKFWTRGYNRNTEWQQAFSDGVNRPTGYSRGYIYWDKDGN